MVRSSGIAAHLSSQTQLNVPKHGLHLSCSLFTCFSHSVSCTNLQAHLCCTILTPPLLPPLPVLPFHLYSALLSHTTWDQVCPCVYKYCIIAHTHTCSLTNSSLNRNVFLSSPLLLQMESLIAQSCSASLVPLSVQ